jgi:cytochrome b561
MQPPIEKFGPVAIFLHWFTAFAILVAVIFGLMSVYTDDAETTRTALLIHQSVGFAAFALVLFRVLWRLTHAVPQLPIETPRSQKIAAGATHALLYVTLIVLPITGYIGLAARGRAISVAGLFDLPRMVPLNRILSVTSQNLHDYGQYVLYALLALHIGAALYHQFALKDGILKRMWP